MGVTEVTRQSMRFVVLLTVCALVSGCGGGKGKIQGDKTAAAAAKSLVRALDAFKRNAAQPDYSRPMDPAISHAEGLIGMKIPTFVSERLEDQAVKEEALAKCKELQEVFKENVLDAVEGKPQDLNRAIEGADRCLELVEELLGILGG